MTRKRPLASLNLIQIIFLSLLLLACGGSTAIEDSINDAVDDVIDTLPECVFDDDCDDGSICSSSGQCLAAIEETDGAGDEPKASGCQAEAPTGAVLYVAVEGSDGAEADGSAALPFASITHALDQAADGTVILVKPGLYTGRIRIRGTFTSGVIVRSQVPYMARLRNSGRVITAYADSRGCSGITIEGFDIAHSGAGSDALVVHLDAGGNGAVSHITLRNNILHDSYNNDIVKINNGISHILVARNLFYNQNGSDEHIDINSAQHITVQDNIFMNDFAGSGRTNGGDTSSFIVVKDSNGDADRFTGSRYVTIRRNIFLNWEGSTGSNFLLLGEDGKAFYEARDVTIENNLMLGNSTNVMRAPLGIKGCRDVVFNNNTITGDLPAMAYAMRFNREGDNPVVTNIHMYNNIWSDPTGTMGATAAGAANDFSDTPPDDVQAYILGNNLYWNGGGVIPHDTGEKINAADDGDGVIADPGLDDLSVVILPRWEFDQQRFSDGAATICEAFENLVYLHGMPTGSQAMDTADPDRAPDDDILGYERGVHPDMGAVEMR